MTEQEYMDAQDLARVNDARRALNEVNSHRPAIRQIRDLLDLIARDLNKKIAVEVSG